MKDKANKKFWDRVASIYTLFMRNNTLAYNEISTITSKYLDKNMSVLELACGTGYLSSLLADKVASWNATDFSEKMISKSKEQSTITNISFSVEDATNLSYNENSFDAVLIANALHIMPNPDLALAEIYRVLKPNGLIFAPTFIYEKNMKVPRVALFIMNRLGYRTYNKWTSSTFTNFIKENKFDIVEQSIIKDGLLFECMIVGRKPRD